MLTKKVEILQGYARRTPEGKNRRLTLRFLVSPVELAGGPKGRVTRMRLVRNTLVASADGTLSAMATEQFEDLDVGLVFRSVGYRGVPLPGVPFHERWGVILNEKGRVTDPETKRPVTSVYATGWIKRGPSGVIGTNKPDSVETVTSMLQDVASGPHWEPSHPEAAAAAALVQVRQPLFVTYADWKRLDALELENGRACGRPRLKCTTTDEMLAALGRTMPAQ
jgi:ferredoxin--NADP+ reductase